MLVDMSCCIWGEFALHEILEPVLIWNFIVSAISNSATKNHLFQDLQNEISGGLSRDILSRILATMDQNTSSSPSLQTLLPLIAVFEGSSPGPRPSSLWLLVLTTSNQGSPCLVKASSGATRPGYSGPWG
jgi:hypothetical protein